jgi:type VI secretion system Hcp family effector
MAVRSSKKREEMRSSRNAVRATSVWVVLLLATSAVLAQDKIFVRIPGDEYAGESTDPAHLGWIEAFSLEHGGTATSTQGGIISTDYSPIRFTKGVDRSSHALFHSAAGGRSGPFASDVRIDVCRVIDDRTQECYYQLTLRGALVTRISLDGVACVEPGNCGSTQTETITVAWARLKWRYTVFQQPGIPGPFYEACRNAQDNNFDCF